MSILHPHERAHRVTDLDPADLLRRGVKGLVLDVDNTLTTHDNPVPAPGVEQWLRAAKQAGLQLVILSNNHPQRVRPFAERLGLAFEANGAKPLPHGVRRACRRLSLAPCEVAVVGDQLFTDILGGRLAGCRTIFVELIEPEKGRLFRFKRRLERLLLRP